MRIGYVVDAGCDLPQSIIDQENVVVLPIAVRIGEQVINDSRQDVVSQQFLDSGIAKDAAEAETIPYTVEQISELFLTKLVVDYDYVMVQTITASRSPIYERCVQASFKILSEYHAPREAAGFATPFNMRVVDTGTLFTGQAVVAWEAIQLRHNGTSTQAIRNRIDRVIANTHGFLVTPDLYYIRNRGRAKGDRSVSLLSAALGTTLDIKPLLYANRGMTKPVAKLRGFEPACEKMLNYATRAVGQGLLTPVVSLAYGGDLDEMRNMPGYASLKQACLNNGVTLLESMMSLTGLINIGAGTLSVAFAQEGVFNFD
ncbi:DegV family EDD domain-containing protein [Lysobacter sp. HDW10]|uniref:DegV family protein n=1 Tax=Lysobacter sp. HDW10 TaxID=2714936 RepID=UPI00140C8BD5|nr:DegV family protein [Lysobacter sp. HDW10]QIK81632.1 DegV family EDD domain-containing protein [Lysobacter sp. HDW10]